MKIKNSLYFYFWASKKSSRTFEAFGNLYFEKLFSAAQSVPRAIALDILPTIGFGFHEIFIKAIEDEAVHWSIFFKPLSLELWLVLIGTASVISGILTAMGRLSSRAG